MNMDIHAIIGATIDTHADIEADSVITIVLVLIRIPILISTRTLHCDAHAKVSMGRSHAEVVKQ